MDNESQWILDRMTLHKLSEEHPDWSLRKLARTLNYNVNWVRKWLQRFKSTENPTFRMYLSQSRAPKSSPQKISSEVKQVVGELREQLSEAYHRPAGAKTILYELAKRDDLRESGYIVPKSTRTITAILKELGYVQPHKKKRRQLLDLPDPMEEWEIDFGIIQLSGESWLEFFLVVDRGTSRVIYIEGCEGYTAETALEAVARLFIVCGMPKRLRFDRDTRFVASWTSDSYPSALVRFLHVIGVVPIICPPRRPDLKPIIERTVKTVKYEWLARFSPDNIADALEVLEGFPHYYNHTRPHQGQACQNQTPDEAFPELPNLAQIPETVNPDRWLQHIHGRCYRRRITSNGTIMIDKHIYYIDQAYAKQQVLIHVDAHQKQFFITSQGELIK